MTTSGMPCVQEGDLLDSEGSVHLGIYLKASELGALVQC